MSPLEASQLAIAVAALVGTVYNVAKTEFTLRTQTRDVQDILSKRIAQVEAELKELISDNRHQIDLEKQRYRNFEEQTEEEIRELHYKIAQAYRNLKIKLNDIHGFLKRMGFFDRPTLTGKDEQDTQPYLDD